MTSPFPGMDPYLERHWRDVHARLIIYACDRIQEQLPRSLRCRVEERVILELPQGSERSMYPDVRVIETSNGRASAATAAAGGIAVAEPLVIRAEEEVTETFLTIVDAATSQRVVTVIEALSPTNKLPGPGRDEYVRKKRELKSAGASLVEIDLLRQGIRSYPVPVNQIPKRHRTTYQILVHRVWQGQYELYRAPLREPLPTIKIPLRSSDPDVLLELQALIAKCYANGRYDDIDYRQAPDPPLDRRDATWSKELLRRAGKLG